MPNSDSALLYMSSHQSMIATYAGEWWGSWVLLTSVHIDCGKYNTWIEVYSTSRHEIGCESSLTHNDDI